MASLISLQSHKPLLSSPFSHRRNTSISLPQRTHFHFGSRNSLPFSSVARLSFGPEYQLPDIDGARELINRAEGLLYTIADAAVSSGDEPGTVIEATKKTGDWLSGITDYLETVLKVLKDGLSALHVPYSYGFAIILLTVLVKGATFPLTKKQVESALAMRSLQPQVKALQERYAGDQERIQLETARLYKLAGVNPLAGCLPTLVTIPIWIGLYRALSNVANEGLLTEGFFWIPSLAGPTTVAARQSGSGTSWLFPFVDGHPPLGWPNTLAYLVLPFLLVITQYISTQIMQPQQAAEPNQQSSQVITKLLPLMIGYFALSVPSGLSLYWLTNNILSTAQQVWLQKLGGAKNSVKQFKDKINRDMEAKTMNSISNFEKSPLDVEKKNMKSSKMVEENPNGLRRGERFKQIKEEEARRRMLREEMRKAEIGTKSSEHQDDEIKLDGSDESIRESRIDEASADSPRTIDGELNGNVGSVLQEHRTSHDNSGTENVADMHASGNLRTSGDDSHYKRDQEI